MQNNLNIRLGIIGILLLATFGCRPSALRAVPVPSQGTTVTRHYKSYDYTELTDGVKQTIRLTIPDGLSTVRGILVVTNPSGGDTLDLYREIWYGEFLYFHDFAFLGTQNLGSHVESYQMMQRALQQIAKDSNHPELVNVPYAATGFSAGGGFASRLMVEAPDRVIACGIVCSRVNFAGMAASPAHLQTPVMVIKGEQENFLPFNELAPSASRPQNSLWGWMNVQNSGHGRYGQEVLAMPFLDTCVRLRYPADGDVRKGPIKLKPISLDSGWLADNTTWKNGLTSIAPASQFKGDIQKSSWLPSQDVAFIYRAFSSYDRPLTIVAPKTPWTNIGAPKPGEVALDPGSDVTIVVDASRFPGWQRLELFDGAQYVGKVTEKPTQITAKNLTTGYHVFTVIGTDNREMRTSNPVMVVVRKLPAVR